MKKLILTLVVVVAVCTGITLYIFDSYDVEKSPVEEADFAKKENDELTVIIAPEESKQQEDILEEQMQEVEPEETTVPDDEHFLQENSKYRIVEPTPQEIGNIYESLSTILETHYEEYYYDNADMYYNLFKYGYFDGYSEPCYTEEIIKYISKPMQVLENGFELWYEIIYENDPLGHFPKIPDSIFNENGEFDQHLVYELEDYSSGVVIGYHKLHGEYIDWIIEGVWNGKIQHDGVKSVSKYHPELKCYYHDGYYYIPEITADRGGGIFVRATIRSLTPIGDNKYMLVYTVSDDLPSEEDECYGAIIAMKESEEGFRFWSIFSIEKLPERSFDVKSMSNEYAQYLIGNANDGMFEIFAAGFSKRELERAYRWVTDEDNIISFTQEDKEKILARYHYNDLSHYTKFDYGLCIESNFYDYFRHFFTDNSIEFLKAAAGIEERKYKLSGIALWYDQEPYEKKVVSVEIDGDVATIICKDSEDLWWEQEYIFKYSDVYGWQLELEKEPSISSSYTLEMEYMCRNVKSFLPEKAEPIERHSDCKNPVLTKEAALDTYLDMMNIRYVVLDFGVEDWRLSLAWATEGNGWVPDGYTDWYLHNVYLAPAVDTNEEFMAHYGQILTEESLEIMQERYCIKEVDGRLMMPDYDGKHSDMTDYSLTEVYSIEQIDNTAICYIILYDIEGKPDDPRPYNFVYSEEHGWRIDCREWY